MKHVIVAVKFLHPLERYQVFGLLHDTDDRGVSGFVLAYPARIDVRYIAADRAIMQVALDAYERFGKIENVILFHAQHVESQSAGRLGTYPRQPREGVN
jgi:hypothetical protein